MSTGWIAFFVFVWIVGTFLGLTFEAANFATSTLTVGGQVITVKQAMDTIAGFNIMTWADVFGVIKLPAPNFIYFELLLKMMTWDFSFMTGNWEYVRWFIFIPISAAGAFGFFILFISAIFGLFKR